MSNTPTFSSLTSIFIMVCPPCHYQMSALVEGLMGKVGGCVDVVINGMCNVFRGGFPTATLRQRSLFHTSFHSNI